MTKATSIDYAVFGFSRHRFVRAIWAAVFVAIALGLIYLAVSGFFSGGDIFQTLFFVVVVAMWWHAAGVTTWVFFELPHRRLTALYLIAGWGWLVWYLLKASYNEYVTSELYGMRLADFSGAPMDAVLVLVGYVLYPALCALICLEGVIQALWQLTATKEGFIATRGSRDRGISGRLLGMPAFLNRIKRGGFGLGVLYFLIAVTNTVLLAVIGMPFYYFAIAGTTQFSPPIVAAILVGAVVAAIVLGRVLTFFAERSATRIYQGVREWDTRKPVVFLRTFDQDNERLRVRGGDPIVRFPAGVARARTLDEILLEHATPYGPVIAIGDPRDPTPPLGAARIFVPGQGTGWQDVVKGLVSAAKAVVMCPNDTEGVKWELDLLRQSGQLHVIFLANPELSRETNIALFASLAPPGAAQELAAHQTPIAAFNDPKKGWRVVAARRTSLEAYTIGLNIALQRIFGEDAVPLPEPAANAAT